METVLRAYAKVNLVLDVLGKRQDGYHDIETIFQSIDLYDTIRLRETAGGIKISCDDPEVPTDHDNLAFRAALLMLEVAGRRGVEIQIVKRIPVAAGLGGGSSDAAAVLAGLNRMWRVGLSQTELMAMGDRLGADVCFFLMGGTALGRGKGEILRPLYFVPPLWFVIAVPGFHVSTREVYASLDLAKIKRRPDVGGMVAALAAGDLKAIAAHLGNVLEEVTLCRYPMVAEIKERMVKAGALGALLSGSGPAVFGIAEDKFKAEQIKSSLSPFVQKLYVVAPIQRNFPESLE